GHGVLAHLQNMVNQRSTVIPNAFRREEAAVASVIPSSFCDGTAVVGRVEQAFRPAFQAKKEVGASAPAVEAGDFSPTERHRKEGGASAPASLYEKNGQLGWLTTAANRGPMLANFAAQLATEPRLFNSPRLLEECKTFVRQPNGAASAAIGAHDDCVLAMAIGQQVRSETAATIEYVA